MPKDPRRAAGYMIKAMKAGHSGALQQMTSNSTDWSLEFRREIQRQLKSKGSYEGPVDGQFGPGTRNALHGLGATAKASQTAGAGDPFAKQALTARQEAILNSFGDVKELERLD